MKEIKFYWKIKILTYRKLNKRIRKNTYRKLRIWNRPLKIFKKTGPTIRTIIRVIIARM
jgi:hypothetical protein